MGGWSGKCPWCDFATLNPGALKDHKRSKHNRGGHKGGIPDTQDMSHPWAGRELETQR